jgi:hypothetical protein
MWQRLVSRWAGFRAYVTGSDARLEVPLEEGLEAINSYDDTQTTAQLSEITDRLFSSPTARLVAPDRHRRGGRLYP